MGTYETWRNWAEECKVTNEKLEVVLENGYHFNAVPVTTDQNTITLKNDGGQVSIAMDKIMYIRRKNERGEQQTQFNTLAKVSEK